MINLFKKRKVQTGANLFVRLPKSLVLSDDGIHENVLIYTGDDLVCRSPEVWIEMVFRTCRVLANVKSFPNACIIMGHPQSAVDEVLSDSGYDWCTLKPFRDGDPSSGFYAKSGGNSFHCGLLTHVNYLGFENVTCSHLVSDVLMGVCYVDSTRYYFRDSHTAKAVEFFDDCTSMVIDERSLSEMQAIRYAVSPSVVPIEFTLNPSWRRFPSTTSIFDGISRFNSSGIRSDNRIVRVARLLRAKRQAFDAHALMVG